MTASMMIRLVAKTTPGDQWVISRELRRRIKYALDEADVEIALLQRTVWLKWDGGEEPETGLKSYA